MSPEETRKNQIRKFMRLAPLDRLTWCLDTGHEILSLLPENKRKKYLEFRKAARRNKANYYFPQRASKSQRNGLM